MTGRAIALILEPCLCLCGCPDPAGGGRYVCRFCAALWRVFDRAHSPPGSGECMRVRKAV